MHPSAVHRRLRPPLPQLADRHPLHQFEGVLIALTTFHLCFLPWSLGGTTVAGQVMSAGLALQGFILALVPRPGASVVERRIHQDRRKGLARSPSAWLILALGVYIALQGLNPSWVYRYNAVEWWLDPIRHFQLLPSGVDAPWTTYNPWRMLMIYASVGLTMASVLIGFTRRLSFMILFSALLLNGTALGLLHGLHQLTGARQIAWIEVSANDAFVATFIYPNHGGAYFYLLGALGLGLALARARSTGTSARQFGASAGFASMGIAALAVVLSTQSRASITIAMALVLGAAGWMFRGTRGSKAWLLTEVGRRRAALLTVTAATVFCLLALNPVWKRFARMLAEPGQVGAERWTVTKATLDLWRDRPVLGWGAGCFRHVFPLHAQRYPDVYDSNIAGVKRWEHAHNDFVQLLAEFGLVGALGLAALLLRIASAFARQRGWRHPLTCMAAAGSVLLLAHGTVDFVFQNPAVLALWSLLLLTAVRWPSLERVPPQSR